VVLTLWAPSPLLLTLTTPDLPAFIP
jgi:hypothetical protein